MWSCDFLDNCVVYVIAICISLKILPVFVRLFRFDQDRNKKNYVVLVIIFSNIHKNQIYSVIFVEIKFTSKYLLELNHIFQNFREKIKMSTKAILKPIQYVFQIIVRLCAEHTVLVTYFIIMDFLKIRRIFPANTEQKV